MNLTRILSIIVFSFIGMLSTAQNIKQSVIIDSQTLKPIPFVNIGLVEYNTGTVSDIDGNFSLAFTKMNDEVTISALGYETKVILIKSFYDTIKLAPKPYLMDVVEISAKNLSTPDIQLGSKNKKRGHSIGFGSNQLGTEVGSPIHITNDFWAKSFHFTLNHAKGDSLLLRLKIYNFEEGQIGSSLLNESIIIRAKQRKGLFSIDLSSYNIILISDVIVTLEWLRNENGYGNESITFDTKKERKNTGIYYRYSSNAPLKLLTHKTDHKVCFYLKGKYL